MFSSKKPYTAVTVQIERLTSPEYDADDWNGIIDLIEVIRIQDTGPTEAARAIRKKLKYGTSHRQLRALTILDGLIQNGGGRFQRTFADEPLLERLRALPRDDMSDPEVREKCNTLFRRWAVHYKGQAGLAQIAGLQKELPRKAKPTVAQSKVLWETERQAQEDANPFRADEDDDEDETPSSGPSRAQESLQQQQQQQQLQQHQRRKSSLTTRQPPATSQSTSRRPTLIDRIPDFNPSSSSNTPDNGSAPTKDKRKTKKTKTKRPRFDLTRETPQITQTIASSNIASTNLLNALKFINREAGELPSSNKDVMLRFEACKNLRREVLRYIQLVESEQWIGSLLQANDDLVRGLMAWEVLEKGLEDDSDSDVEEAIAAMHNSSVSNPGVGALAGAENKHRSGSNAGVTSGSTGARSRGMSSINDQLRGINVSEQAPSKPPRPPAQQTHPESESEGEGEDLDEDNPFGDHAAIGR